MAIKKTDPKAFDARQIISEDIAILGAKINTRTAELCNALRSGMFRDNRLDIQNYWEIEAVKKACAAIGELQDDIRDAVSKFNQNPAWRLMLHLWLRYGEDDASVRKDPRG